ncbi:hypothetical protein BBJ28_00021430 [Nothophytophthora sp. Chile5]|nr:hypothetical protein BBJ28_00021430 [Nothophytophthora sp. Chile5]
MQRAGVPVGPAQILMKGNEVLRAMTPRLTRSISATPLTRGWYTRFMKRHHVLTDRLAQSIARVRNEVDEDSVSRLFYTLAKLDVEEKFDATRVFNMDETSFMPKTVSRKAIAVKGSVNVWKQQDKLNFHMTVVAAVSAAGGYIPPLLIVPGSRIFITDLHAISVDNTCLSGAPKGFSNTELFKKWLMFFSEQVKQQGITKPVVLVADNSSTHLDIGAAEICAKEEIFLVMLPANATHLFQPLDVAVFKPFKPIVQKELWDRLCAQANPTIPKADAIRIACDAYRATIMERPFNAIRGFQGTGVWPLSLVQMHRRLLLYRSGGVKGGIGTAEWLKRREEVQAAVRDNILTLPPPPPPPHRSEEEKATNYFEYCREACRERAAAGGVRLALCHCANNWYT